MKQKASHENNKNIFPCKSQIMLNDRTRTSTF